MHHQISVFFTLQHLWFPRLEFLPHALLGLNGPLRHGGVSQPAHFFDQQFLELVGGLQRTLRTVGEFQNPLNPLHHLGLLTQPLNHTDFFLAQFARRSFFVFHPNCI